MMKRSVLLIALFCLVASALAAGGNGPSRALGTDGPAFVDQEGRRVILRGVNAGGRSKFPPFLPFDPGDDFEAALETYADGVAAMGFNVVRLLVIYEAAEPVRGTYDQAYLSQYDAMVRAFAKRGIYVIVDGHQDLFSRRFHGDGFPDWAIAERYRGREQTVEQKMWNVIYFTRPVLSSLQGLWSDRDGVQRSNVEFYGMLAERYKEEKAVIGFEPINEPMPGWKGLINYPGFHRDLYKYYQRVAEAVQSVDPGYMFFADICALENPGTWNPWRPRPKIDNLVLAPHYYDLGTFGMSLSPGGDKPVMAAGIGRHLKLARHWDVPAVFTEYGVSPGSEDAPAYIGKLYSIFDDRFVSGTFWEASMSAEQWNFEDTSIFTPEGELRPNAAALDRPYPTFTAGVPIELKYCPKEKTFVYRYSPDPSIAAPTGIYLPAGLETIEVEGGDWSRAPDGKVLLITPAAGSKEVRIQAK